MDDIHNAKLFNSERYIPETNHHYYSITLSKIHCKYYACKSSAEEDRMKIPGPDRIA